VRRRREFFLMRGATGARLNLALLYALLAAIVLLPLALVQIPGLGDYPNNLARIHVMEDAGHSAALRGFFDPSWHIAPYYGMDLTVLALAQFMPIYAAGRCFAALCLLMPVLAAASLRRVLFGRVGLAPCFAFLLSYSYIFSRGFLNYIFTVNAAIMVFALWIAAARAPRAWHYPAFALAAAALYLSHVFGFLVYGLLVAGFELQRLARADTTWRPALLRLFAAAVTALPALILAGLGRGTLAVGTAEHTAYGSLAAKFGAALSPFYFPSGGPSVAIFAGLPVVGLVLLWRGRVTAELRLTLALTALAAAAMPSVLFNLWGADFRLPVVLCVLVLACLAPRARLTAAQRGVAALCLILATGLRAKEAAGLMQWADHCAAQTRAVLSALPHGAKLLVVQDEARGGDRGRVVGHLGALATIDRDAFVPFIFTYATPIRLQPAVQAIASPNSGAIDLAQLRVGEAPWPQGAPLPGFGWGAVQYWRGWPAHFEYVLLLDQGESPAVPPRLHLLLRNAYAALYRVGPPPGG